MFVHHADIPIKMGAEGLAVLQEADIAGFHRAKLQAAQALRRPIAELSAGEVQMWAGAEKIA